MTTRDAQHGDAAAARPVRVVESYPRPRATTNPYLHMLDAALGRTEGVDHRPFDRVHALVGRYDVLHFHWPETLLGSPHPVKRLVRRLYATALLLRLRLSRTVVVRTVHNVELPSDLGAWERWLLTGVERLAALRITLNDTSRVPHPERATTIAHGHYVDWFADAPPEPADPHTLGFVGLVRRYKGLEQLLTAFAATSSTSPALRLAVSGNPTSGGLREEIEDAAKGDDRVRLDLRYLSETDFAQAVMRCQGVVLPYRFMHNSGTALAALSLARPVLVPANDVNTALAREVGPGWVHTFEGDLDASALVAFAEAIAEHPPTPPDLSARDWDLTGVAHRDAFRRAVVLGRPR